MVIVGALVAFGLMFVLLMRSNVPTTPWLLIGFLAPVVIIVTVIFLFARRSDAADDDAKAKRGLEGLDLYSVIDRLVDDLDDDEAAYLQRRLDERDAKNKNDLTVSLDDLLERRAQDRQNH